MGNGTSTNSDILTAFDCGSDGILHQLTDRSFTTKTQSWTPSFSLFQTKRRPAVFACDKDEYDVLDLDPTCLFAHSFAVRLTLPALTGGAVWPVPPSIPCLAAFAVLHMKDVAIGGDQVATVNKYRATWPAELLAYEAMTDAVERTAWSAMPHEFVIPLPLFASGASYVPCFLRNRKAPQLAWKVFRREFPQAPSVFSTGARMSLEYETVHLSNAGQAQLNALLDAAAPDTVVLRQAVRTWTRRDFLFSGPTATTSKMEFQLPSTVTTDPVLVHDVNPDNYTTQSGRLTFQLASDGASVPARVDQIASVYAVHADAATGSDRVLTVSRTLMYDEPRRQVCGFWPEPRTFSWTLVPPPPLRKPLEPLLDTSTPPREGDDVTTAFTFAAGSILHGLASRAFTTQTVALPFAADAYGMWKADLKPLASSTFALCHSFVLDVDVPALAEGARWATRFPMTWLRALRLAHLDTTWGDMQEATNAAWPAELVAYETMNEAEQKVWSATAHSFSVPLPFAATTHPRLACVPLFSDYMFLLDTPFAEAVHFKLTLRYESVQLTPEGDAELAAALATATDVVAEQSYVVWRRSGQDGGATVTFDLDDNYDERLEARIVESKGSPMVEVFTHEPEPPSTLGSVHWLTAKGVATASRIEEMHYGARLWPLADGSDRPSALVVTPSQSAYAVWLMSQRIQTVSWRKVKTNGDLIHGVLSQ
jgi:hypothetical protein